MDDIKTWTGLSVEESIRMTEDRDKWRKYVHSHGVAEPRRKGEGSTSKETEGKRGTEIKGRKFPPKSR